VRQEQFAAFRRLMARMLVASSVAMTRKALAIAVVLLIAGLAPATAVIGFCAKMPCCFGDPHDGPSVTANRADCCTTISCYEAPSHELTVTAKVKMATTGPAVVSAVIAALPAAPAERLTFDNSSPPPTTRQRLSTLAILLI
jgi:hypothetical protein